MQPGRLQLLRFSAASPTVDGSVGGEQGHGVGLDEKEAAMLSAQV